MLLLLLLLLLLQGQPSDPGSGLFLPKGAVGVFTLPLTCCHAVMLLLPLLLLLLLLQGQPSQPGSGLFLPEGTLGASHCSQHVVLLLLLLT
jgi:hypothetical protein